jgi:hypothetical protein
MRAALSVVSILAVQIPSANPQSLVAPVQNAIAVQDAPAATHIVTVPSGTVVPLTLINPIKSKSTKPGDAVRATVAFPVTVGSQLAIPPGSYVEGTVRQVTARAKDSHQPAVLIEFTRLLFPNGYSVNLVADSTQAMATPPPINPPAAATVADDATPAAPAIGSSSLFAQQSPQPPTLPQVGPSPAVVTGAVLGGAAALTVLLFAIGHHQQSKIDYVLFDAGWQFQMTLESPLVVDADRIASAASVAK